MRKTRKRSRLRVIALTLIMTLVLGSVTTFAAATYEPPYDENNPIIKVVYERVDPDDPNQPFNQMTATFIKGSLNGRLEINGTFYDLNKTYTVTSRLKSGHFATDDALYDLHATSVITPVIAPDDGSGRNTYYGQYNTEYELVKTDSIPENSSVLKCHVSDPVMKIVDRYFVNDKSVTAEEYENSKVGAYSEKVSTKYDKDLSEQYASSETTYLGYEERDVTITMSDGSTITEKKAIYKYRTDEHYTVEQQYIRSHKLTVEAQQPSGGNDKPSGGTDSKPSEEQAKPAGGTDSKPAEESKPAAEDKKPAAEQTKASVTKPAKVKITSAAAKKTTALIRWKRVKKATSYQIKYSTNKKFRNAKTVTVKKAATSKKLKNLKRHKRYYIKVRALKGKTRGSWSKVKRIKTK